MPSHYLNQCWHTVNWALGNKFQWNSNEKISIFIQEDAFENAACKVASICLGPNVLRGVPENLDDNKSTSINREASYPAITSTSVDKNRLHRFYFSSKGQWVNHLKSSSWSVSYGGVEGPTHIFCQHHVISYGWLSNSAVWDITIAISYEGLTNSSVWHTGCCYSIRRTWHLIRMTQPRERSHSTPIPFVELAISSVWHKVCWYRIRRT